ncbi:hypothetical protein SAMN05443428_11077 [Caloramator quimbayensis]|uniref:Uncharacterized protein n=1 Tax=Caloramator quimbayensis TaxID=1147123 RepID=A0A1T4XLQ0_9CLOT|nr:hypothetical protein [Caloramator quimbayensis]SKA90457.1 hypothetical protein SAMN05443428_11077 [Caloramator quimbayensis]
MDKLLIIALFTESIWETIKLIKKEKGINTDRIGAIVVGILICVLAKVDLFKLFGVNLSIEYLGYILTGFIVSRGSNFLHDLLGSVDRIYQNQKNISK